MDRVGTAEIHRQHDVLDDRDHWEQLKELEDNAEILSSPARHLVFVQLMRARSIDPDFASGGAVNAGNHVQQGGFAAARFADNADEFACVDLQVHTFQRVIITDGGLVIFVDLAQVNDGAVLNAFVVSLLFEK